MGRGRGLDNYQYRVQASMCNCGIGTSDMVVSQNRMTQYRPPNTIILFMGTPKRVPLFRETPIGNSLGLFGPCILILAMATVVEMRDASTFDGEASPSVPPKKLGFAV